MSTNNAQVAIIEKYYKSIFVAASYELISADNDLVVYGNNVSQLHFHYDYFYKNYGEKTFDHITFVVANGDKSFRLDYMLEYLGVKKLDSLLHSCNNKLSIEIYSDLIGKHILGLLNEIPVDWLDHFEAYVRKRENFWDA